jgi:hypothetical protein
MLEDASHCYSAARSCDTETPLALSRYPAGLLPKPVVGLITHRSPDVGGRIGSSLAIGRLRAATSQALRAECPGGQSKKPGREVVDTGGWHANSAVNR